MKLDRKLALSLQIKKYALGPFLGMYRSLIRGQGVEYDEIRKYIPGDEPKAMVWAKLAQTGEAFVKTFHEERDLTVIVALDISSSVFWARPEKATLAAEVASILLFSAAVSRDRVGLALFSENLDAFIPPRRGMSHVGKLVEMVSAIEPMQRKTSLKNSLQALGARRGAKRAALFVISDFMCQHEAWEDSLLALSKKNDVIAMRVQDAWEKNPQPLGWIYAKDAEQEGNLLLQWDDKAVEAWKRSVKEEEQRLKKLSMQHDIGRVDIEEGRDPLYVLRTYFERRCRILKRR